ncbi:MAG: hypothetical protein R3B09_03470 [Nannocystaceae bacterium]
MTIRNLLNAALLGLVGVAGLTGCDVPLQDYYELRGLDPLKGVAYDPGPQVFYTTSLVGGEIEMVTSLGRQYLFHRIDDPQITLHGAALDAARRRLWVCAVDRDDIASPGHGWLLGFDVEERRLEVRVDLRELHQGEVTETACEAVDVADDGVVYAVDPSQPVVYRYDPGANRGSILARDDAFAPTGAGGRGLGGVAVHPGGEHLIVARTDPPALFVIPLDEPHAAREVSFADDPLGRPGDPRFPAAGGLTFVGEDLYVVFLGAVQRVRFTDAEGLRTARVATTTAVPSGLAMATSADGAAYALDGDAFKVEVLGQRAEVPFSLVRVDPSVFAD